MKTRSCKGLFLAALAALALGASALAPTAASAATPNYSAAVGGIVVMPFHISGQYTADTADVVKLALPFKARLIGATGTARASGGTNPTLTFDVLVGGTSILSAPKAITAGTVAEATIATPVIADEASVTVNLAITGTNPTWNDITLLLTLIRQ